MIFMVKYTSDEHIEMAESLLDIGDAKIRNNNVNKFDRTEAAASLAMVHVEIAKLVRWDEDE